MNESQIERAMRILAELYADQIGMKNPKITITRKGENTLRCGARELQRMSMTAG